MKIIKKILSIVLTVILTCLITILVLSLNLKSIIMDGIIKETLISNITSNKYKEGNKTNNFIIDEKILNEITDDERVKEILKSKEVEELVNKYLDITIDTLIDEENIDEVEIEKDIYNYLKENKEELTKIVGQEVTDEMIDNTKKQLEDKNISRAYRQNIDNARKNITNIEKNALKTYKLVISLNFRTIIIVSILINIVLIFLLKKSFRKTFANIGYAITFSGITLIIMSIATNTIVRKASNMIRFNINSIMIPGIILLIFGLLIIVINKIIKNIIAKKEDKNEIPKLFNN